MAFRFNPGVSDRIDYLVYLEVVWEIDIGFRAGGVESEREFTGSKVWSTETTS